MQNRPFRDPSLYGTHPLDPLHMKHTLYNPTYIPYICLDPFTHKRIPTDQPTPYKTPLTDLLLDRIIEVYVQGCIVQEEGPENVHPSLFQHLRCLAVALVAVGHQVEQLRQQRRSQHP